MDIKQIRRIVDEFHGRQQYGTNNYLVHLEEVRDVLRFFEFDNPTLHKAVYLHDAFEDTDFTPALALQWGIDEFAVAIAFAVTDEPGQTRKERKAKTYLKIKKTPAAIIVKLADRIANVEAGGKIEMYKSEYPEFRQALFFNSPSDHRVLQMWDHLDNLLK